MKDGKLSPAQYARRTGQRTETVYAQLRQGRLPATKTPDGKWRIDPNEAPRDASEDLEDDGPSAAPRPPRNNDGSPWADAIPDYEDSRAARMYWQAKCAEQEYLEKAGKLVPLEGIEQRFADHVTTVRAKILGLPSRLKTRLRLSEAQHRLVTELVEEALMSLDTESSEASERPD